MRLETERLVITEFATDMAKAVHENSLDEDTRRFLPDEVFETVEDALETIQFLMTQYASAEGPYVYPVLLKDDTNIGYVQLVPNEEGWEIGYHIAKQYTGVQKQFEIQLPDGYKIKEIDDRSLERLEGTILPSLFWRNASDFLTKGKGYCITIWEETGVGLSLYEYSIPKNSRKAGISKGKRVYADKAGYLKHVR